MFKRPPLRANILSRLQALHRRFLPGRFLPGMVCGFPNCLNAQTLGASRFT